jgi:hypothetical protein
LVVQQRPWLQLGDFDVARSRLAVRDLGSRYERLTADAPDIALGHNAKPRLLRLMAPTALHASDREIFYVFAWPPALSKGEVEVGAATALAAMPGEGWEIEFPISNHYANWKVLIVDIGHLEYKIVVKVDGCPHRSKKQKTRDTLKGDYLRVQGWQIIRFWNAKVEEDSEGCVEMVMELYRSIFSQ